MSFFNSIFPTPYRALWICPLSLCTPLSFVCLFLPFFFYFDFIINLSFLSETGPIQRFSKLRLTELLPPSTPPFPPLLLFVIKPHGPRPLGSQKRASIDIENRRLQEARYRFSSTPLGWLEELASPCSSGIRTHLVASTREYPDLDLSEFPPATHIASSSDKHFICCPFSFKCQVQLPRSKEIVGFLNPRTAF